VSSRVAEKERRRAERAEREEQRAASERRARRLRIAASAAVATALAAAAAATIVFGGSSSKDKAPAAAAQPFGQHYAGLEQRRQQAGVPTMMQTMNSPIHYHPQLSVFVDGRRVAVPANIGIDPRRDPMDMAGLHTHDTRGTIHVEGADNATLGKFFRIWGVPLSADRLGPYASKGRRTVRMWVDGRRSHAFGALKLADGQRIVVSYGSSPRAPAGT
jgi:cytochrome oxidase Cu insertion factor (SCO1/SenC/PrrC family)